MIYTEILSVWISSKLHVFLVAVTCFFLWIVLGRKKRIIPPGPRGLPIVGYQLFMGKEPPYLKFANLSKKYGDIMSVNLMGRTVVCLNSYEAICECFATKAQSFSGRPSGDRCFLWWVTDGMSISQDEGPTWAKHRRFTLHALRDCGFGKVSMEARVQEIGKNLISALRSTLNVPFDPFCQLSNTTLNVMYFLTCSKLCDMEDASFRALRENLDFVRRNMTGVSAFYNSSLFPVQWYSGYSFLSESKRTVMEQCLNHVRDHEKTYDETNLRDYTDLFLHSKKAAEKRGEASSTFTEACTLWGYHIPKRSVIFANLWAANHDEKFWDEPENFIPERFLDPKMGKTRRERMLTFSVGKRACLGETLARMELFIFLTMMLQKFVFKLAKEEKEIRKQNTFIRALLPFQVLIQERS